LPWAKASLTCWQQSDLFENLRQGKGVNMQQANKQCGRVTLRTVADRLGLTPGTISAVLNNTRAADRIPQHTRERVIAAARELNYQPNPLARALRTGKAFAPEVHDMGPPHGALVIVGADRFERALDAIQQAGLRASYDFSVVDFASVPSAWDHPSFASAPDYPAVESAPESL
jgi:DNA-binding LacI/PurR family transcriptional regulator